MALASKQSQPFYVTTGGGADEINAARKTTLTNAFTSDKGKGNVQLIDDNTLGPIVFNIQRMQDDIDELRRYVDDASELRGKISPLPIANGGTASTSTTYCDLTANVTGVLPNANVAADLTITAGSINNTPIGASSQSTIRATTIDASTDFTVGTTVVTSNDITMTPSPGDTAQIRASANGALGITTVDAAGSDAAITITSDGNTEIDAREITLDSGGNIELETGTVTNYINTTGVLRSGNQGDIQYVSSEYYIPITATDFQGLADSRGGDQWGMDLDGTWISHNSLSGFVEKLIPLGFKATGCIVYGDSDGSGDNEFRGYEGAINASTNTARGTATTVNVVSDFTTQGGSDITGDGLKTCRIILDTNEARDSYYGGKIILEKV